MQVSVSQILYTGKFGILIHIYLIQNAQPAWLKRCFLLGKFPSYRAIELWSLLRSSLMDNVLHNRLKSSQQKGGSISTPSSLSSSSSCSRQPVSPVKQYKTVGDSQPTTSRVKVLLARLPRASHSAALGEALKRKRKKNKKLTPAQTPGRKDQDTCFAKGGSRVQRLEARFGSCPVSAGTRPAAARVHTAPPQMRFRVPVCHTFLTCWGQSLGA